MACGGKKGGKKSSKSGKSCKKIQTIWYKTNIERFQNKNR